MERKILIVRKYSGYGGIEFQIENIVSNLMNNGWQIFFLSDVLSPLSKSLEEKNTKVIIKPFHGTFRWAIMVKQICKENGIGLIQSHVLKDSFVCRIVKLLKPSLIHVFRVHTYIDCSHISRKRKNLYHFACWITDPLVDMYISINEYNIKEMKKRTHLLGKKMRVVPNVIRPLTYKKEDACEIKNGHIAMIANFVDFKGHDVLIEGIKILKERHYHIVAHLFGSVPGAGTEKEDHHRLEIIKELITKNQLDNVVEIHGYSPKIEESIKDCGIVVLPSDAEGTPNALLQGMMLHKIIVASKVGGIPEFVVDGKTGFLHDAQDPRSFADAIIKVYNTSDEVLKGIVEGAAKLVEEKYDVSKVISTLIEMYGQVMR